MTSYVANNNPHVSSYLFSRYSTYYQSFCLPCSTYHFPAFLPHSPMLPPYVFLRKPNTPFGPAPIPSRASSREVVSLRRNGKHSGGCWQQPSPKKHAAARYMMTQKESPTCERTEFFPLKAKASLSRA